MRVVRDAEPGDGEGIAEVWASVGAYYAELDPEHFQVPRVEGLAQGFEEVLGHRAEDELHLVAELGGSLVGCLFARLEPPEPDAASQFVREHGLTRLAVDTVIVHRKAWRRGVGRALVEAGEQWARDRGAIVVRLDTYAESPVSVPFYEGMGYRRRSIVFQKRL
jgi:GNAT superfamily N-acetyltransferase